MSLKDIALQLGLPESVANSQEMTPLQQVGIAILREKLPGIPVHEKIPDHLDQLGAGDAPLIVVRRIGGLGLWAGRPQLLDSGSLVIHTYTQDPNGETKGAMISEAARKALFDAYRENWYNPNVGALARLRVDEEPIRKTDFATTAGPVQFADLPIGWWRFETRYMLRVRPPTVWSQA